MENKVPNLVIVLIKIETVHNRNGIQGLYDKCSCLRADGDTDASYRMIPFFKPHL